MANRATILAVLTIVALTVAVPVTGHVVAGVPADAASSDGEVDAAIQATTDDGDGGETNGSMSDAADDGTNGTDDGREMTEDGMDDETAGDDAMADGAMTETDDEMMGEMTDDEMNDGGMDDEMTEGDTDDDAASPIAQPGFGVLVGLLAIALAAGLIARWRD